MTPFSPKAVLVTGGAGFIGSNFISLLLAAEPDARVINLDLLTYAGSVVNLQKITTSDRYHFIQGDITDTKKVTEILRQYHIDTIIHFAAESHVDRSISRPETFIQTNIVGTFTLLEAARQCWLQEKKLNMNQCRFHQVSTDEVYGALEVDASPFNEQRGYAPNSPYSASKAAADHLVRAFHKTYGLPITISCCSNNYGPHQHAEKFIPTIIRCCLEWQRIPVYGEGNQIRDWLYVDDHCQALLAIIKLGKLGEVYNIGGDNEWENIAIVKYICHLMDEFRPLPTPYKNLINFIQDRPGHDFRYAIDASKIKKELQWAPQENFATGILKTIDFYLTNTIQG